MVEAPLVGVQNPAYTTSAQLKRNRSSFCTWSVPFFQFTIKNSQLTRYPHCDKQKRATPEGIALILALPSSTQLSVLESSLVRNGQLLAALCTTCCQYLTTVSGCHSLTETVLVDSLPARRLECSFHRHNSIFLYFVFKKLSFAECKGITFLAFPKILTQYFKVYALNFTLQPLSEWLNTRFFDNIFVFRYNFAATPHQH